MNTVIITPGPSVRKKLSEELHGSIWLSSDDTYHMYAQVAPNQSTFICLSTGNRWDDKHPQTIVDEGSMRFVAPSATVALTLN